MTEREGRPAEQQAVGAEQRRHFGFEATATSLGIPQERWEQPAVRSFVEIVNRVKELQIDLHLAGPAFTSGERTEETASIPNRYLAVDHLLRAASEILTDGFAGKDPIATTPDRREYLRDKVNTALEDYGLEVVEVPRGLGNQIGGNRDTLA